MKIISLNTWGGKVFTPLIDFVKDQSKDTDIFCFQEVFSSPEDRTTRDGMKANLYQNFEEILKDFKGFIAPQIEGQDFGQEVDYPLQYGLAMFVKKDLKVLSNGDIFVYLDRGSKAVFQTKTFAENPRNMQYVRLVIGDKKYTICTFHGIAFPPAKVDTENRINQCKKVKEFLDKEEGNRILCGDFNLNPDTESIALFEKGYENLIKEFEIKDTRGKMFSHGQRFADYTFVSEDVEVKSFEVPDVEISDHLPMILEAR